MLHWLPNVLSKQQRLFWGLWLLMCIVHAIVLIGYLVYSRPQPLTIHISKGMLRGERVVRVLPFVRSTGQLQRVFESGKNTKKTRRITTRKAGHRAQLVKQVKKVEPVPAHMTKLVSKKKNIKEQYVRTKTVFAEKLKITKQQKATTPVFAHNSAVKKG